LLFVCRYGLFALHWILEVNGQATPDLDSFLKVVEPLRDGDFARVKVCHLETTQHKVSNLDLVRKWHDVGSIADVAV
jgi:hypothetical protein